MIHHKLSYDPYGPVHGFVGKPYEKRVPRAVRVKPKGPGKTRTAPLEKRSRNEQMLPWTRNRFVRKITQWSYAYLQIPAFPLSEKVHTLFPRIIAPLAFFSSFYPLPAKSKWSLIQQNWSVTIQADAENIILTLKINQGTNFGTQRARLPVSNIWNNRLRWIIAFPRIITPAPFCQC